MLTSDHWHRRERPPFNKGTEHPFFLKHFLRVLPIRTIALGSKAQGRGTQHSKHSSHQTVDSITLLSTKISENLWAGLESITAKKFWNLSLSVWKTVLCVKIVFML